MRNKRKSVKKSKKKFLLIKIILTLLLLAGVLVLLALSPVFNTSSINVYGNSEYDDITVINASEILIGGNSFKNIGPGISDIFTLRSGQAENKIITSLPYVKKAVVKFIIPDLYKIYITEREPFCIGEYLGKYLLLDADGNMLETDVNPESLQLPLVKGIDIKSYVIGEVIHASNLKNYYYMVELINAIINSDLPASVKIMDSIDYFDVCNDTLKFIYDSRVLVNFGMLEDLEYKVAKLRQIIIKNISQDEKGIIDFTVGRDPVFIPEKEE